ncbi:hypothetical protein [Legionella spiritensis]|uniref:Membrane protein n=1 Tax=Legionella spiritensis TaxID=452 RepID=A0A0W0Z7M9_LEGSP|nr:hypothetical protein [Legionella spiritensis]KTD64867.1 membrane protein [Legionella spiritensis]SNV40993.1 membrane protein [Legionella spiritensis]
MPKYKTIDGGKHLVVPLGIKPYKHQEIPSVTGSAISIQAGTVLYGYYNMDYRLPDGDLLRLLANHDKKTVQIILLTGDPEKLKKLPGQRTSSLAANAIASLNRYCIRSESYSKPRTEAQLAKFQLVNQTIRSLSKLLARERRLAPNDWAGQEALRHEVLTLIEQCRDQNRLVSVNPIISEGSLGTMLYEARQAAQHYEFNRVYPVSRIDQLDFTRVKQKHPSRPTCFVWDSELHIGQNEEGLNNAIRVICEQYGLVPAPELSDIPANRFKRLELFFHKLWLDGYDWINYLANHEETAQAVSTEKRPDGLAISKIKPYYCLEGTSQKGFASLPELAAQFTGTDYQGIMASSLSQAWQLLTLQANGHWARLTGCRQIVIRLGDDLALLNYFEENGLFYPLPSGQDLYTLSQISKRHLYLPEKFKLQLRAFASRIPPFFKYSYQNLKRFVTHDLYKEFTSHVHHDHPEKIETPPVEPPDIEPPPRGYDASIEDILIGRGLLHSGQTLEQFVREQMAENPYVIAREQHPSPPPLYTNPLHRSLDVLRHIAGFFVDVSEKNPIIGTLAMAAYLYGAGAVIAPQTLIAVLTKLHLSGLISGIRPAQALGHWMSHGTTSEAISSATTLWQGIVIGGDLDQFFIKAVSVLQDDPAEVALIIALALSLGYGLCKTFPSLQEEMGPFPLPNYAALGAKGGAAIYDTIVHPGDDWLLGTIKWLLKAVVTTGKIIIGPFVEGYYYGYEKGFLNGLKKSVRQFILSMKQIVAGLVDFVLVVMTIPFLEISAMAIHVPFRGLTNFLSKLFAFSGHWQPTGQILLDFATRTSGWNYLPGFRLSPLYGFSNPLGNYSQSFVLNLLYNAGMLLFLPPLQLLKNFVVLPLVDTLSFLTRATLTLLNPVSRLLAFSAGTFLTKAGFIWDNSIGYLFRGTAKAILLGSNLLASEAGELRLSCLELIQTGRRALYDWAFAKDDQNTHVINTDRDYFIEKPIRLEQLPHEQDHCLLDKLLHRQKKSGSSPAPAFFAKPDKSAAKNGTLKPDKTQHSIETASPEMATSRSDPEKYVTLSVHS